MRRFLAYLKYIILHKWYVFNAGLVVGAPIWRLIIHDWSKFLPSEWGPYSKRFHHKDGKKRKIPRNPDERTFEQEELLSDFNRAFTLHVKRNKHHWQYWVYIRGRSHEVCALDMPDKYIYEMVADWCGAGRGITGSYEDIFTWYPKNKDTMILSAETRMKVEFIIKQLEKENL